METAGFYILAFGVLCVVFAFWFAERKTPRTPIPDDESLPRPFWRSGSVGENPFIVRMAAAIEESKLEEAERDLRPPTMAMWGLNRDRAFRKMLDIQSEYWRFARVGPGTGKTNRVNARLEQMITDEINRPSMERATADAAREKYSIEDASILKGRGMQSIIDFAPEGVLVRISTNRHGIVHFLRVHNGTVNPNGSREEYAICVPNECRTVKAALAWTYGIEPEAYEEVVRT